MEDLEIIKWANIKFGNAKFLCKIHKFLKCDETKVTFYRKEGFAVNKNNQLHHQLMVELKKNI